MITPHRLKRIAILCIFIMCCGIAFSQQVTGYVCDAATGERLAFVNVSYLSGGKLTGTTTDREGKFVIADKGLIDDSVTFQYLGYNVKKFAKTAFKSRKKLKVAMLKSPINLAEARVVSKHERYRRKENPAVALMRKVIANRQKNSMEGSGSYSYRKHEKVAVSVADVDDSMRYSAPFRKIDFVFDNMQVSELSGRTHVPMYFIETLSEITYNQKVGKKNTVVTAVRDVEASHFLDPNSLRQVMQEVFGTLDLYQDKIHMLGNEFISPISPYAILFYHFYLLDTVFFDGDTCVNIAFGPANSQDFGFTGRLTVALDTNYTVRKVLLDLPYNNAVNFVEQMRCEQEFARSGGHPVLRNNITIVDFNAYGVAMYGKKKTVYGDYRFDSVAGEEHVQILDRTEHAAGFNKRSQQYWQEHSIDTLDEVERKIYADADSLNHVTAYRVFMGAVMALATDFVEVGKFNIGPLPNTLSWNAIEGFRLRMGGSTNIRFHEHLFFSGFAAYGTHDQRFKYRLKTMYSFNDKKNNQYEFPLNLLSLNIEANTNIHGHENAMDSYDRFFLSFGRGTIDKMTFDRRVTLAYEIETQSRLSAKIKVEHVEQEALANLDFTTFDGKHEYNPLKTDQIGLRLRYAPGESFYQNYEYRVPMNTTAPIFTIDYSYATKLFDADFEFHKLKASLQKRWFVLSLGFLDLDVEAGKVFGKAPYPLLFVHNANQNWAYQDKAFNLMNYFEFVSDQYVQVMANYNFNGFIFNRIPLWRKLKLREVVAVKAVWGEVTKDNIPCGDNPELIPFPTNDEGQPTTFMLWQKPYVEANVGIDNIFKVLRVDLVRRFTYLDNPDIAKWGIRFRFHLTF